MPLLTNFTATPAVTLFDQNRISGLKIQATGAVAIQGVSTDIKDISIDQCMITSTSHGVNIGSAIGPLNMQVSNSSISGGNATNGLRIENSNLGSILILNCAISSNTVYALDVGGCVGGTVIVENCAISALANNGIDFGGNTSIGGAIKNCTVFGGEAGLRLNQNQITSFEISGSTFTGGTDAGLRYEENNNISDGHVTIENCAIFTTTGPYGFHLDGILSPNPLINMNLLNNQATGSLFGIFINGGVGSSSQIFLKMEGDQGTFSVTGATSE